MESDRRSALAMEEIAIAMRSLAGNFKNVEGRVELLLGDLATLDVPQVDDGLTDRDAVLDGLLRYCCSGFVADVPVERGHDRR